MGATKKHFYKSNQLQFANLCKALGHPARIAIIQLLSENQHLNCNEIQSEITLAQPTISWHCRVLHECGILGYEVIGNNCYFRLNPEVMDRLSDYIHSVNKLPLTITDQVYYPAKFA